MDLQSSSLVATYTLPLQDVTRWASAFSASVAAYRRNKEGQATQTGMSVLV